MGGRALVAGFGAAAQVFLLAVSIAGAAYAEEASAGAQPAGLASTSPSSVEPAPPPPGEADREPPSPAATPPSDGDEKPAEARQPPAETAAPTPGDGEQKPVDAAAPPSGDAAAPKVAEEPPPAHPIVAEIRLKLQDPVLRKGAASADLAALEAFYGERAGPPLWITTVGFTARAQALIAEIQKAGEWGLAPEAFDLPPPSDLPTTTEAQAIDEIKLALAVLKYARFAKGGRVSPARISTLFDQKPSVLDPKEVLSEMAASASPAAYLTSLHPRQEQFERLRQALVKAVSGAKARGRKPGGEALVQRLVVNMERWRWMPTELGSYYVWNNVPAFTTRVMKDGKSIYVEKAIVGQVKYATPIFSSDMLSIVFNPVWVVPDTIKIEDLQPRLRQGGPGGMPDVSVLRDNKLSVSHQGRPVKAETIDWGRANIHQYTFTQAPGPDNVLGVLKFNFPNRHAVYMHDTTQPELFNETVRTLSHGCIRLRQPDRLAALLLAEDKGWPAEQVKSLIAKGNNAVLLSRPVPVHLTYFTMALDGVGKLRTFADIYGLDSKMASALFGKSEALSADAAAGGRQQKRSVWNTGMGGSNSIPGVFGN